MIATTLQPPFFGGQQYQDKFLGISNTILLAGDILLESGGGTGGEAGTQAILLTAGDFPQALAVYATKSYSSCVSRRTRTAALAQRYVKRTWGARWHLDTSYPHS